jgi:hypothetical protein
MKTSIIMLSGLLAAGLATPASAFGEAECAAGITMIKAEIDKNPPAATLTKLKTALRVAEREAKEREFDECEDAIKDASKALGKR